ncbi:hypothetical protein [Persicobacter psychrovividus]|uniref:MAPEG family protein n=1 Tax=Persicobacter psychrovividus TaxID=387638 RepID=A0ABM7VHX4_9BACT|nr:hypothetical protein PEPS_28560 [Persicobacter psychrovividus]
MTVLTITLGVFLIFETLNIILLYFFPGSTKGNALGVFKAYEASKQHPELHRLIRYLINWVAGTKLIFVVLLLVILIAGDSELKLLSMAALIITITTFFWRMYPMIRQMDRQHQLTIRGYSVTLGRMIGLLIAGFALALWLSIQ